MSTKTVTVRSPMLLALYHPNLVQNPTEWLVSEKLDGVRALWDGSTLLSRNGIVFVPPQAFLDALPRGLPWVLDGELYISHSTPLEQLVSVLRGNTWLGVRFLVFDAQIDGMPYSERLQAINKTPYTGGVIPQVPVRSHEDIATRVRTINGEGIVVRHRDGIYEFGKRSRHVLKHKRVFVADGVVVSHDHSQATIGVSVLGGIANIVSPRQPPPIIGSQVRVRYYGLTAKNAKPRGASLILS